MISSVEIVGYRGFTRLVISDLGRVNLLVGKNNSGKTSVLEAIFLLTAGTPSMALARIVSRRGERLANDEPRVGSNDFEADLSHLFHGHSIRPGVRFTVYARNNSPPSFADFYIDSVDLSLFSGSGGRESDDDAAEFLSPFRLVVDAPSRGPNQERPRLPLSRRGGIRIRELQRFAATEESMPSSAPSSYISTESISGIDLVRAWDAVALSPDEDLVLRALQFLDPNIERIAAQTGQFARQGRGGFIVKQKQFERPVPIGSLGDGMWRLLAIAIALTQSRGGVLLIDEIDTGLHYTAMSDMWRLIHRAAKEFNVQVFATTHSSDCVQSLADIATNEGDPDARVTLQRIEMGKPHAVAYSEGEIRVAAERHIEVR